MYLVYWGNDNFCVELDKHKAQIKHSVKATVWVNEIAM